ncbi:DUF1828 domain-containing protein [Loigolactobacillus jiayinensis]|uniref:DUF1828 domain-containing protein n=1 Tax=Loigolactobacillus jiayinensis TaxID=2486016 RepID=A0ABW1RF11_9LACO|nr:DUF1828 domain-containing protein [Loigolactobacillus jiayinensis]
MNTNKMLDDYANWLRTQYKIKSIGAADEITTPFVNSIGDNMRIYVQSLSNNRIQLSDDGITIEDLELSGIDLSDSRKSIINNIKRQFSIDQLDDVLSVSGSVNDFPNMKQRLTSAILKVSDLAYTKKSNIDKMFFEEVYKYFETNDFGGLPHYAVEGKSGVKHNLNYVIPARNDKPFKIIDFQNRITKNDVMIGAYKYRDINDSSEYFSKNIAYSIIYNDSEMNASDTSQKIAYDSGITIYTWSDKKQLLALR